MPLVPGRPTDAWVDGPGQVVHGLEGLADGQTATNRRTVQGRSGPGAGEGAANVARMIELGSPGIEAVWGDITVLQVDAVVNAANAALVGRRLDVLIHRAAGAERLRAACAEIGGCLPGRRWPPTASTSPPAGSSTPCSGPVWRGGDRDEDVTLASCYRRSLDLAAVARRSFRRLSGHRHRGLRVPSRAGGGRGGGHPPLDHHDRQPRPPGGLRRGDVEPRYWCLLAT